MGLFDKLFPKKQPEKTGLEYMKFMDGYTPFFAKTNSNLYESEQVRSVIHFIATHVGKLNPRHIIRTDDDIKPGSRKLENKLRMNPNPLMSGFDFFYKVASQLLVHSNVFIFKVLNDRNEFDYYPLNFASTQLLEEKDGSVWVRYSFNNGRQVTIPYSEVIHLRRYYNEDDIFGSGNDKVLYPIIQLIDTTNQGIINAVKSSAHLRGILKFSAITRPEDMVKERDRFVKEYLGTGNNGGIGATDMKSDFVPTEIKPHTVDDKQMAIIDSKIYKFFNVNENLITSKYSDEEWDAFYENILSPIANQLSIAFTLHQFSDRERGFGNEILFEASKLHYASTKTKIRVAEVLYDRGSMNPNEIRAMFNLAPREGGEEYFTSLNFVSTDIINEYQLGKKGGNKDDD